MTAALLSGVFGGTLFVIIGIGGLIVSIWAIVDAATTPTENFKAAGSSKALWITLIAVLYFLTGIIGTVLAIVYLAAIRPKVRRSLY